MAQVDFLEHFFHLNGPFRSVMFFAKDECAVDYEYREATIEKRPQGSFVLVIMMPDPRVASLFLILQDKFLPKWRKLLEIAVKLHPVQAKPSAIKKRTRLRQAQADVVERLTRFYEDKSDDEDSEYEELTEEDEKDDDDEEECKKEEQHEVKNDSPDESNPPRPRIFDYFVGDVDILSQNTLFECEAGSEINQVFCVHLE